MKKLIAIASSMILALALTACGNNSDMGNDMKDDMSSIGSTVKSDISDITSGTSDLMSGNSQSGRSASTAKITADEAKAAALKHAGVSEGDVTGITVDLDRDNGILIYEVDFHSGGVEYDYDINAEDGKIVSADRDRD